MRKNEINFTNGKMLSQILLFAIPLMLSGMLQLFYNAADIIVVGRFAGEESLGAVGSTSSLINLLTNAFLGLSVGANVIISRAFGTKNTKQLERAVHTSILLSLLGGVVFGIIGFIFARPILAVMDSPADVIDKSTLYMKIYFLGLPATALYNFGSAVLRAVGDTKRPLYFLIIAGVFNIVLNLFFVIVMKLDVAGVGLATVIAQVISAGLVVLCLMRTDSAYKLVLSKLKICKKEFFTIVRIGLPAGVQGSLFAFSNVIIQSTINSFGSLAVAANSASASIEGFVWMAMNSMNHTALTFTAQNVGVKNANRIKKGTFLCLLIVCLVGVIFGGGACLLSDGLLSIYSKNPEVIKIGTQRLFIISGTYFICGIMDTLVGAIRGFSCSIPPMIISLVGVCGLRILWIRTLFNLKPELSMVYITYPISWALTTIALGAVWIYEFSKFKKIP